MPDPLSEDQFKQLYLSLDRHGQHEMVSMIRSKLEVFQAVSVVMLSIGFLLLALFLKEHTTPMLAASILALILGGKFWQKFWGYHYVLAWTREAEDGE